MRIAQVAPLFESVPPKLYGGTERVVSNLTEALVDQGHDVTLFASGDSETRAHLVAACERSLRLDTQCIDQMSHHVLMLEKVFAAADSFDVVHFHIDYMHFPLSRRIGPRRVTTLHGRLDIPDLVPLYREFPREPLVSISGAQRKPIPWANWVGTVYHGLPDDLFRFEPRPDDYLAFLGRISPEKGIEHAVEIARRAGLKLRVAAKVDAADREYYEAAVRPLFDAPGIEFLGEINEYEKQEFLGKAFALLFPITWPEPFGLVMIEAMACGTPIVAFSNGSVPEVMEEGVSGFTCDGVDAAVEAVGRAGGLSRIECRRYFERRFTAGRMASDYVEIYQRFAPNARRHSGGITPTEHERDTQAERELSGPGQLVPGA
jgi:glycosyltransferase involved in cell wall biosynthesis